MNTGPRHRQPATRPQQEWQGRIERLGWGGVGVGRLDDGRIVLLRSPLALFPGEVVRARIELRARHAEGIVSEWLERDARRATAGCPVAATCGGCSLWEAGLAASDLKWGMVQDLLGRQLRDAPECKWLPAPSGTARSRIQLSWDGGQLGYHRTGSNVLVQVSGCPMAADPVSAAIPLLQEGLASGRLPTEPDRWELATGTPARDVITTSSGQAGLAWLLDGGEWKPTRQALKHELGRFRFTQSPGTFFQVCPQWGWLALGEVLQVWQLAGDRLYDLYGGSGFFSLLLADRFGESVIVESGRESCGDAAANLEANSAELHGLSATVECADVATWLTTRLGEPGDVILLDPPRAGLPQTVAARLVSATAGTIVLVGCDGMAFCRDILRLAGAWKVAHLAAIDLFPNTPQVEFIALLRRN